MRTTSMASGVVTLRPPLNSDLMPRALSMWEICGPPPCTTIGCRPKDHVFGEALLQMVIDHGIAAVFDDDTLAGELLQPWQRFNKHFCLLIGAQIGVHVEMEPRSLQFCRQFFSFLRRRRRYRCRLLQTAHWAVCQLS